MNLFIFSSNNELAKIIIFSFLVFIIYSLILHGINPKITTFQNQWIANYSKAEKYIYKHEVSSSVIVGSSMSARLVEEKLKNLNVDVYNLSFGGGSVLTGLNIIKKSNIIPKVISIETNIIERTLNSDMVDDLFTPIIWQIKGRVPSLQYTYQPINIVLTMIRKYFGSNHLSKMNRKPNEKILKYSLITSNSLKKY